MAHPHNKKYISYTIYLITLHPINSVCDFKPGLPELLVSSHVTNILYQQNSQYWQFHLMEDFYFLFC